MMGWDLMRLKRAEQEEPLIKGRERVECSERHVALDLSHVCTDDSVELTVLESLIVPTGS
jgi:hypothetical protein